MELIGKWKIKKVFCITPNGMELLTPDELPQGEDYDEYRLMNRSIPMKNSSLTKTAVCR